MNLFPSFIVDKRKYYSQNSTHLLVLFPNKGKRVRVNTNYVQLLLIGLCLGVTLGVAFVPFLDIECSNSDVNLPLRSIVGEDTKVDVKIDNNVPAPVTPIPIVAVVETINSAGINSKSESVEKPHAKSKEESHSAMKSIRRPRFFSSELGLKHKLIAGIILTDYARIDNLIAINRTLGPFVNQLIFFVVGPSAANRVKSLGISGVVTLADKSSLGVNRSENINDGGNSFNDTFRLDKPKYNRVGLRGIKYFGENFVDSYDYFFIGLDVFYINGKKLLNSVKHISVSREVLWGAESDENTGNGSMCKMETGFVISSSLIRKLSGRIDRCLSSSSLKMGGNLSKCFYYALGSVECSNSVQNQIYVATPAESSDEIFKAIAVGPVSSHQDVYRLHMMVSEKRSLEIGQDIEKLAGIIDQMAPRIPKGFDIIGWPTGVPMAHRPSTRFDVLNWKYFTLDEMYPKNEHTTEMSLSGIQKLDISSVVNISTHYLQNRIHKKDVDSYPINFEYGYRRFDETRGMEYILNFQDTTGQAHTIECLRPLTKIEIVPMPFITESRRLTIVLPITLEQFNETETFLANFVDLSVDKKSNTILFLAVIHRETVVEPQKFEPLMKLKRLISEHNYNLNRKDNVPGPSTPGTGTDTLRIGYFIVNLNKYRTHNYALAVFDMLSERVLSSNALVVAIDTFITVKDEFLNRVRMNTILNYQIFSPIPFFEYNPLVTGVNHKDIEIHKATGYFNSESFGYISFVMGDYAQARKYCTLSSLNEASITRPGISILSYLFVQGSQLHIMRVPEPSLKVRFSWNMYENCSKTEECFRTLWGAKVELAKLIFQSSRSS